MSKILQAFFHNDLISFFLIIEKKLVSSVFERSLQNEAVWNQSKIEGLNWFIGGLSAYG